VPALAGDFAVPPYFAADLFSVLGARRPDWRWLIIGPDRSGSSFHVDPNRFPAAPPVPRRALSVPRRAHAPLATAQPRRPPAPHRGRAPRRRSTGAWNAVISGRKKWVMFPPHATPPGVAPSVDGAEVQVARPASGRTNAPFPTR